MIMLTFPIFISNHTFQSAGVRLFIEVSNSM